MPTDLHIDAVVETSKIEAQIISDGIPFPGPKGNTGEQGPKGDQGDPGDPGVIQSITAGSGINVDATDPANPIIKSGVFSISTISALGNWQRFLPLDGGFMIYNNNLFPPLNSYSNAFATNFPFAGSITKITVQSIQNASDGTDVISVYKNGLITSCAVLIANGQRSGSDLLHPVSFVADTDFLSVVYNGNGNFNDWRIITEITPL